MTFFHGATTAPATAAANGNHSYAVDAANAVVNPPTSVSKTVTLTGLSIANGSNYYLKWTYTGTGGSTNAQGLGIDNFSITATSAAAPTITTSGTLAALSTTYGTASSTTSFSVSGANLTGDLLVTPPSGFEVSTTAGSGYTTELTLAASSGTVSNTTVFVRLRATAGVGTFSGDSVVVSGGGATLKAVAAATSTVTAKALTITGLAGENKVYDGTTAATFTGTPAYSGLVNGQTFETVTGTGTASFDTATVGTAKTVTVAGYTPPSANYTVTNPTVAADITAKSLTITADPVTKAFGTTLTGGAGSTAFTADGLVAPETVGTVTITYGAGAAENDVANTYPGSVTPSLATGGTFAASNYTILYVPGDLTVSASPTITVGGTPAALSTIYGTASTATTFTAAGGNLSGDLTVTAPAGFEVSTSEASGFASSLALTAVSGTVATTTIYVRLAATTAAGTYPTNVIAVTGGGATQQTISVPSSTVNPKVLTIVGISALGKTYDATTAAALNFELAGVSGNIDGANIGLEISGATATFDTEDAGVDKVVTVAGLVVTGPASGNYTLTQPTLLANINPAPLTVTGLSVVSKAYDGTTAATLTGGTLTPILGTDTVGFTVTSATFASAAVGTNIPVDAVLALNGADATNYELTQPTGLIGTITASTNANLASLTISTGTLSPVFSAATLTYSVAVGAATETVAVTPTMADAGATITVNGSPVTSGAASQSINLAPGINTITIVVTAADLTTTKTYTVNVAKQGPFTAGNFVVERIGDGASFVGGAAVPIALQEFAPGGTTPVQSIEQEFTGANLLTEATNSTSNGHPASYGGFLAVPGLNTAIGTANASGVNAKATHIFNALGGLASRTLFPTTGTMPFTGSNMRSVVPVTGTTFYASGTATSSSTGGVWYYDGTTFTQLNTTLTNIRNVAIYNNQLYVTSASGSNIGVNRVGTGLPTTAGQAITLDIPAAGSPYGFVLFDTNADNAPDLAYVADDRTNTAGAGLRRFDFNGTTWTNTYSLMFNTGGALSASTGLGIRGLAGSYNSSTGTATLVATTTEGTANRLVSVTDSGTAPTSYTTMATAPANTFYRGLANAPVALPDLTVAVSAPASGTTTANFDYTLTVSNSGTATATGVTADFTLPAGVSFVSASGPGFSAAYGAGVANFTGGTLAPAASATLTVTVSATTAGPYTAPIGAAVVDAANAIAESNEANNSSTTAASTGIDAAPVITQEPVASQTIASGATATLTVVATGTPAPAYQWYAGLSGDTSAPVDGATADSFTTPALTAAASFWVRVSNSAGHDDSATAQIFVSAGTVSFAEASQTVNPVTPAGLPTTVAVGLTRAVTAGPLTVTVSATPIIDSLPAPLVKLNNTTDYTLNANTTTVTFNAGESTATLNIPLKATVRNGRFQLELSNPSAGELGTVKLTTIEVAKKDTAAPTLTVNFPAGPTDDQVSFTGTATDGGTVFTGIDRVELTVVNVSFPLGTTTDLPLTGSTFGGAVTLEHGVNKLTVTAYDKSGKKTLQTKSYTYASGAVTSLVGTYTGLLLPSGAASNDTTGYLTVTVAASTAISGKLTLGGITASFSGALNTSGHLFFKPTNLTELSVIDRAEFESYLGSLSIHFTGNTAVGTLKEAPGGATLATATAVKNAATAAGTIAGPSATVQKYSVVLPSKLQDDLSAANYPQGDGYASITVKANGSVAVVGSLADGTAFTASGRLQEAAPAATSQAVALHVNLYKKKGALATTLAFDLNPATNSEADVLGANSLWIRPALPRARYYPAGWPAGAKLDATGSRFNVPTIGSVLIGLSTRTPNAQLQFADGDLTSLVTRDLFISPTNAAANKSADPALKLSIAKGTGIITGTFTHSGSSKPAFKGIIIQEGESMGGYGYFRSDAPAVVGESGKSGGVTLLIIPEAS